VTTRRTALLASLLGLLLAGCAFDAAPAADRVGGGDVDASSSDTPDAPDVGPDLPDVCTPVAEVCDGADNDCDGDVDEETCATPTAQAMCVDGACEIIACTPGLADCDGDGSNGCEADFASEDHCGGCRRACVNPFGTTECVEGTCTPRCGAGAIDADGDPANGCELLELSGPVCGDEYVFPDNATVVILEVQVCPFDGDERTGKFVVRAGSIHVDGRIRAEGAGHRAGGGGGGGGGGVTADRRGEGGNGGESPGAAEGQPGDSVDFACCESCGGGGGAGGAGAGVAAGTGGQGGGPGRGGNDRPCRQDGNPGGGGDDGAAGGYDVPGANMDTSTDLTVLRGSGGGGGGGGGGSQPQSWSGCECPGVQGGGGGGGGGGAAGSAGGGAVELHATKTITVIGQIDTRGAKDKGGRGARGEDGPVGDCGGVQGGDGGRGGAAQEDGNGRGREGGRIAVVCGVEEQRGPGGRGGDGGSGGGGGILLVAPSIVIEGTLDARPGEGPENLGGPGGSIKLFHCGEAIDPGRLRGGRVLETCSE
jgi:hypothetical protein